MRFSRRRFCRSTIAAAAIAAVPAGLVVGQSSRVLPSAIAAVKLNGASTSVEAAAVRELGNSLGGILADRQAGGKVARFLTIVSVVGRSDAAGDFHR